MTISFYDLLKVQRHHCMPSMRWKTCCYHCVQILAARLFTIMCHSKTVQTHVFKENNIKILVEALDPNRDPVSSILFDLPSSNKLLWLLNVMFLMVKVVISVFCNSNINFSIDATLKKLVLYPQVNPYLL